MLYPDARECSGNVPAGVNVSDSDKSPVAFVICERKTPRKKKKMPGNLGPDSFPGFRSANSYTVANTENKNNILSI